MTIPFKPGPDDTLVLFNKPLTFRQHPSARIRMPNSQEGGRATVYELRDPSGRRLALKVFRPLFREPALAQSGSRLTSLRALDGMDAAQRDVVLPGDEAVRRFPDLEYALLMPWIEGETWTEMMLKARDHGAPLERDVALHLCARFLRVVRALETAGASHTDIAGGNVVVQMNPLGVQLLDLEDMYLPTAPRPANPRPGSPGYQHRLREPVFCPQGDRYAAAVLAAEILALANPALLDLASDTGMFGTCAGDAAGDGACARIEPWLRLIAPPFAEAFRRAWHAPRLAECPTIAELHDSVEAVTAATPLTHAAPERTVPEFQPPRHPNVGWGKPVPPAREPLIPPPPPSVSKVGWNGTALTPVAPPAAPRKASGGGDIPLWLILALAVIFVGLLVAVVTAS